MNNIEQCVVLLLLLKFPSFELLTTHTETNRLINGQFASAWITVPEATKCRKNCSKVYLCKCGCQFDYLHKDLNNLKIVTILISSFFM